MFDTNKRLIEIVLIFIQLFIIHQGDIYSLGLNLTTPSVVIQISQ